MFLLCGLMWKNKVGWVDARKPNIYTNQVRQHLLLSESGLTGCFKSIFGNIKSLRT